MTPEAARSIEAAREHLSDARKIMSIPLAKVAARSAYYAAFHAAEALIIARTGKAAKTHSGVRSEFARLLKSSGRYDAALIAFLSKAYKFKELGDYSIGRDVKISDADATDAIRSAESFIENVFELLTLA